MRSSVFGTVLTVAGVATAVCLPFYIFWRFGLHWLGELTGIGYLALWLYGRSEEGSQLAAMQSLQDLPCGRIALFFLGSAAFIRVLAVFALVPDWAAGSKARAAKAAAVSAADRRPA